MVPPTPILLHDHCVIAALLMHCNIKPQDQSCRGSGGAAQDAVGAGSGGAGVGGVGVSGSDGGAGGWVFNGECQALDVCGRAPGGFIPSSSVTEGSWMLNQTCGSQSGGSRS